MKTIFFERRRSAMELKSQQPTLLKNEPWVWFTATVSDNSQVAEHESVYFSQQLVNHFFFNSLEFLAVKRRSEGKKKKKKPKNKTMTARFILRLKKKNHSFPPSGQRCSLSIQIVFGAGLGVAERWRYVSLSLNKVERCRHFTPRCSKRKRRRAASASTDHEPSGLWILLLPSRLWR